MWEGQRYPRLYWELFYFSQILKADLADVVFPQGSTVFQYVDELLFWSSCKEASEQDSIRLLKLLVTKVFRSLKRLLLTQIQIKYPRHLISDQGLLLDSKKIQNVSNFPQTKRQLQGFGGLARYCRNWIPNFFLIAQSLYALLKAERPDPLEWEENTLWLSRTRKADFSVPLL